MKMKYTLAALAATTLAANAAVTAVKATADFTNNYDGNEIYDGTSYVNGWASAGGLTGESTTGSVLTITGGANGWIEHNTGDPILGLGATDAWTLEVTVGLTAGDGFVLWQDGSNGGNGALIYIGSNGIGLGGNGSESNQSLSSDANIGVHTFRIAFDDTTSTINLWRNNVLVSDTIAATNPGGGPRLIIGDCCSGAAGVTFDTLDIHNVSYDTTGAFAAVPEPSSAALIGLGGLALILRRRK